MTASPSIDASVDPPIDRAVDHRPAEDLTTRARIRDAAMAEFAEHGYRGATMRGIAATAGVSLGLVQHYFGTKDGLRAACDDRVLDLVRLKTAALEDGRLADQDVLERLMTMAPPVQRYLGRGLVDGSPRMAAVMDRLIDAGEQFLTTWSPDLFTPGTRRARHAAAAMTVMSTSTMVLQEPLARQLDVRPFSEPAIRAIGQAMLDVYEAIAEFVASDTWTALRAGMAAVMDEQADNGHQGDKEPTTRSDSSEE